MGRYINPPENWPYGAGMKREYLRQIGAQPITLAEARENVDIHGIIVWVDNGFFEAAGYAYNRAELDAMTLPRDSRPKQLFTMSRHVAEEHAK